MATKAQMEQLAGMAAFDPTFRDYILKDPAAAAASKGIKLTDEQIKAIKSLDRESIDALSVLFSKEAILMSSEDPDGFWLARAQQNRTSYMS